MCVTLFEGIRRGRCAIHRTRTVSFLRKRRNIPGRTNVVTEHVTTANRRLDRVYAQVNSSAFLRHSFSSVVFPVPTVPQIRPAKDESSG
jgi:hypothetical protein